MKEKSNLEELKKNYSIIQQKYNLPEFNKLNQDFQIEKIAESETDFLIREVRKFVAEKLSNYLRFVEMILQPTNVPMSVFSIIKTLGTEDKDKLTEIYKKLVKFEVDLIEADVDFSEEKEAKFIRSAYIDWQDIKKNILGVVGVIKNNLDNKFEKNGRKYFG